MTDQHHPTQERLQQMTAALRAAVVSVASLNPIERNILEILAAGGTLDQAAREIGLTAEGSINRAEKLCDKLAVENLPAAVDRWNLVQAAGRASNRAPIRLEPIRKPSASDSSELALEVLAWLQNGGHGDPPTGPAAPPSPPPESGP